MIKREQVREALKMIKIRADYEFFFEKLHSPNWLEPLEQEGVFQSPEEIIIKHRLIEMPYWPPAKYLVKVAPVKPDNVVKIIRRVPDTNNTRVYEDLVDAAIAMPTCYAVKLTTNIVGWLDKPYQLLLPEKVAKLIARLCSEGKEEEIDDAIKLADKLLDVHPPISGQDKVKLIVSSEWEYNQLLKLITSNLKTVTAKSSFILLLSEKLKKSTIIQEKLSDNDGIFIDFSLVWRQSIEKPNQAFVKDIYDILIEVILCLAEQVIQKQPERLDQIVEMLLSKNFPILGRIALYLAKKNSQRQDIVLKLMLNQKLAESRDTWHEYALLLQGAFDLLDKSAKKQVLNFFSKFTLYNINDEKREIDRVGTERKRYEFYYLIQQHLTKKLQADFAAMKIKYGEIENPTFYFYSSGVTSGPGSPITADELNKKNIHEIADFLRVWKPPETDSFGSSSFDLAQTLEKVLITRIPELTENLSLFKQNEKIYVVSVIHCLTIAVSEKKIFNWDKVIKYLVWAIAKSELEIKKSLASEKNNINWSSIKEEACHLLQKGFLSKENPLPIKTKERVWAIIGSALNDFDPDEGREREYSSDANYHHLAINSTRGIGLETAIRYGLWVMNRNNIKKEDSNAENYNELFIELNNHLDISIEKSKAVHSIYGLMIPWLFLLDKKWTIKNLSKIFPLGELYKDYRSAAWETYILYGQLYNEIFEIIQSEYLYALDDLSNDVRSDENKVTIRLVEHIVLSYLRGIVEIDSRIMLKLYQKSNLHIRSHIINFVGRFITEEFSKKAIKLWEYRLQECSEQNEWGELVEFGWWTESTFLDEEWILDQIIETLKRCLNIKPMYIVMDQLIIMSDFYPEKVTEIFKFIVDNKIQEYGHFGWLNSARILIPKLLKTKLKGDVILIINKLGAYGFNDFGQFLD